MGVSQAQSRAQVDANTRLAKCGFTSQAKITVSVLNSSVSTATSGTNTGQTYSW